MVGQLQLKDVQPDGGPNAVKLNSEDFEDIIEEPVKAAIRLLYDRNVQTTFSSANRYDVENRDGFGWININYDTLSPENKLIADMHYGHATRSLGESGRSRIVQIRVPLFGIDELVADISDRAVDLVSVFQKQSMTWADTYDLAARKSRYDTMVRIYQDAGQTFEEFEAAIFFCDERTGLFYDEAEHLEKVLEFPPADYSTMPDHRIRDVEPLAGDTSAHVDISKMYAFVEPPLILAVRFLRENNIAVMYSSANRTTVQNGDGLAKIVLDYGSLSEQNKRAADAHYGHSTRSFEGKKIHETVIDFPILLDSAVEDVAMTALHLAYVFKRQDLETQTEVPAR